MAFTEGQERFIEASIPVVQCGEQKRLAEAAFESASDAASEVAKEALGEDRADMDLVYALTLEAARRAGFADDSEVVVSIHEGFEAAKAYVELMNRLANQVLTEAAEGGASL